MRRRTFVLGAIFASLGCTALAQGSAAVSVLYTRSLATPMEGAIKTALAARGIVLQGESGGTKQLASLIASGAKNPDVFIGTDPKLVSALGSKIERSQAFASTSLGIGWSENSKFNALFQDVIVGKTPVRSALETPGLRIGRTDPQSDAKGAYTVQAVTILAGADDARRILGADSNSGLIYSEEKLQAQVEKGDVDVGFFYKPEALALNLHFFPLPGAASLSDKIIYTLAVMRTAPHPDQAKAFAAFIVNGEGKAILQKAGLTYLPPSP